MGTHLRVLTESYPKNTNMTGLDGFLKYLHPYVPMKLVKALEGLTGPFTDLPWVDFTPVLVLN